MQTKKSNKARGRASKSVNTNKRRKRTRRPQRLPSAGVGGIQVGHLSTCSETYLRVLSNPFMNISNACIPDTVTLPSTKLVFTSRGVFSSGTTGFAAIGVNPWSMIHSGNANGVNGIDAPVVKTEVNYAFPSIAMNLTSADLGVTLTSVQSNSVFGKPNVVPGTSVEFRLVGCGLRCRYTGTEQFRAGRMTFWRPRQNSPIIGANLSVAYCLGDNYYTTTPIDRSWREITYLPVRSADITYSSYVDPLLVANTDYRVLWCLCDGTTAASSFEYEVKAYFEVVGQNVGGGLLQPTKSHADPVGFGAIMSSLPTTLQAAGSSMYATMKAGALKALEYATSGVVTMGARALGNAAFGPAGGYIAGAAANRMIQGVTIEDADD